MYWACLLPAEFRGSALVGTKSVFTEFRSKCGQEESYRIHVLYDASVQFSSVAQSCPTLCNSMNRSTPGLPVHHQLPEFTRTHVEVNVYSTVYWTYFSSVTVRGIGNQDPVQRNEAFPCLLAHNLRRASWGFTVSNLPSANAHPLLQ